MKTYQSRTNRIMRGFALSACIAAIASAGGQPAHAANSPVPPVPAHLEAPSGNKLFLVGHATGTQQYMCLFNGSTYAWSFFGPQATLFGGNGKQVVTHYLSPNPAEGSTARATWQHMNDGSVVWAAPITSTTDPAYVAPGAIPWLLLEVKDAQAGPTGGDKLTRTTFIQRLNTAGGVAPASGCAEQADIGKKALAPYTTDYFFYRAAGDKTGDE
jgi:hypothetical protein